MSLWVLESRLKRPSPLLFRDPGPSDQRIPTTLPNNSKLIEQQHKQQQQQQQQSTCFDTPIRKQVKNVSCGYGEEFFDAPESPEETSSQVSDTSYTQEVLANESVNEEKEEEEGEESNELQEKNRIAQQALEIVLRKLSESGFFVPKVEREIVEEEWDIASQIAVKKMVVEAVARGAARAEAEMIMESEIQNRNNEIENKNREVTRLRDKVRYNELVSREMSQRNQESIGENILFSCILLMMDDDDDDGVAEIARKMRRMRRRKMRIAAGFTVAAVSIGVCAAVIYKYGGRWRWQAAAVPEEEQQQQQQEYARESKNILTS